VYNFTREFPFIWEELRIGIAFDADHARAERILLDAAIDATREYTDTAGAARRHIQDRYGVELDEEQPRVYWRLTDNWLELTVRMVVPEHGIRDVKDRLARHILPALKDAGIGIASTTFEVVGLPPLRLERAGRETRQ
jgi:small-conductance mechanosensitive channel